MNDGCKRINHGTVQNDCSAGEPFLDLFFKFVFFFFHLFIYLFISNAGSKSQSALWNAITAGMRIKGKEQKAPLNDPRSPEEILADDLPAADEADATEKTAIRFASVKIHEK